MSDGWEPPVWLVDAATDAFLGGRFPEHMTREMVVGSGIFQAMHDLGVRFSQATPDTEGEGR